MNEVKYTKTATPRDLKVPRYGNVDEARKLRRMIRSLKKSGWHVHSLAIDGEDTYIRTGTERAAVCEVFEWDAYVTMRFRRADNEKYLAGVLIVTGNGDDMLSDWTFDGSNLDTREGDTFTAAMNRFCDQEESRLI